VDAVRLAVLGVETVAPALDLSGGCRLRAWQHEFRPGTDALGACQELRTLLVARSWDTEVCGQDLEGGIDSGGHAVRVQKGLPGEEAIGRVILMPGPGLDRQWVHEAARSGPPDLLSFAAALLDVEGLSTTLPTAAIVTRPT